MHETPDEWDDEQRALFSRLYRHMEANPGAFQHPSARPVPTEHWLTTCWNAAWCAANWRNPAAPPLVHVNDDGEEIGAEVPIGAMS
jgi:hypothetical protein